MKKWAVLLVAPFIIYFLSFPVEAARWKWISETTSDFVYIDYESISLLGPNGPKEVWIKFLLKSPECNSDFTKSFNKCMQSMSSYQRFFSNKSACILQQTYYFTDNNHVQRKFPCDVFMITPDSVNETIWKFLFSQNIQLDRTTNS